MKAELPPAETNCWCCNVNIRDSWKGEHQAVPDDEFLCAPCSRAENSGRHETMACKKRAVLRTKRGSYPRDGR